MAHAHQMPPTPEELEDFSPGEVWRTVPTHPDYEVSESGRVQVWRNSEEPIRLSDDRVQHSLRYPSGAYRSWTKAQIVADAFLIPRPGANVFVGHLDGDKRNNHWTNLYWCTYAESMKKFAASGRHATANITHCKRGHEFTEANTRIDKKGARVCRKCTNAHNQVARLKLIARANGAPHEHITIDWFLAGKPKVAIGEKYR